MKVIRKYTSVIINNKAYKRQKEMKHPWIYDNEIENINGSYSNGDLVDVKSIKGSYIGTGYINDNSKIRVRIISRNANDTFDEAFYKRRIKYAINYRKQLMKDISCCRIIFGESDGFPGLTIDKYNDILVSEVLSLGIEKNKDLIYNLLIKVFKEENINIKGIYERNDNELRIKEGLEKNIGFYPLKDLDIPKETYTYIMENNIRYKVDFANGQKTGFFLDQKYNRLAIQNMSQGRIVLDCFTHTGSFGLNASFGGALKVTSLDISDTAIKMAQENAKLNNITNVSYIKEDAFNYLANLKPNIYDFIILDPPAFTKAKDKINNAYKGYKEINYLAMKAIVKGGYLATCSCSHFMSNENFHKMLEEAAFEANVTIKEIEIRKQALDHPILWNVPETSYLKFYILQII